ncbi:hypothetical protein SAMN03159448_03470 [Sinorhizobium sp. NFACC03]|nr:hypothetical protein SAMN03159448_03470 [Sinorhizobium sp. NFACC03]
MGSRLPPTRPETTALESTIQNQKARRFGGLFRVCCSAEAQFVLNFFTSMKLTALPLKRAVSTVPAPFEKPAA